MTILNGALVLLTGATGGFGTQLFRQLLDAGSRVAVTDLDADALQRMVESAGNDREHVAAVVPADLSTRAGCRALADAMSGAGLLPDVLVNNAGIAVAGRIDHVPAERWEALMQVNLLAPMRLTSLFLPGMIERGSGHILNVSSLAAWVGSPGISSYCAAKFGLRGFGEALALDLDEHGVRVSNVYPSFSDTPIIDSDQFGFDEPRAVPRDILTNPADIAAAMIEGIRRNRRHIFPDRTARVTHYLVRFVPWVIPLLQRRLDRLTREAGRQR